jgi:hypothetical protein
MLTMALVALALPSACSDIKENLLEPQQPGTITPEAAASPAGADALRRGALGRLRNATEGGDGLWLYTGLLADEYKTGDTFVQRVETDRREFQSNNGQVIALERNAHRLRQSARDAIDALEQYFLPNPGALLDSYRSQMWWVMGYAEMTLAENWCNGMPYSMLVDGVPVYGTPRTSLEGLRLAGTHLDSALTFVDAALLVTPADTSFATLRRAIQLTRARIMVDTANFTGAEAIATTIPSGLTGFIYKQTHSLTTSDVGSWSFNNSQKRWVVGDSFDTSGRIQNAIPFASANDQRVPVQGNSGGTGGTCVTPASTCSLGAAFDNSTRFVQQIIWNRSDEVPILSGLDARLIEAEAQIQLNTPAGDAAALALLNGLRATPQFLGSAKQTTAMAALAAPATHTAMIDLFFREKAFWQFGRGWRSNDMRRLMRQYGRAQTVVFPMGPVATNAFFKGGVYGTDIVFPVTSDEAPNPNYAGCLDRNP